MSLLALDQVSVHFGSNRALDKVSINFEAEKTHVLLGTSGSGKSTILRLILGLIKPTKGYVSLEGQTLMETDPINWSRAVGYVPQEGRLFPHLTAFENMSLVAKQMGWNKAMCLSRAQELCLLVSIDKDLLDRYPQQMSGGQRQRVALMRAVFLDPKVMLLDEPLGALDPITRVQLQAELRSIFVKLRKTVVLVTHDLVEAAYFGDVVSLIHEGRVLQSGSFKELFESPKTQFVKDFVQTQKSLHQLETLK